MKYLFAVIVSSDTLERNIDGMVLLKNSLERH